jgi:hypothetical protein
MSVNPTYWKMCSGTFIDIDSMDVNHLRNVLKMIVKNSNKHKDYQKVYPSLNGDMANEFNNSMFNDDELRDNQW